MSAQTSTVGLFEERSTLLDGSMGQELINRGAGHHDLLWAAGALLHQPEIVRQVHDDYIAAGADIITTNSYSTIRSKFEPAGLMDRFEAMNRLAGRLAAEARDAAERPVWVAGSLPPQHGSYRPDRVGEFNEIEALYREQAELLAPYVDLFLCETMSTADEARAAATAALATGKPAWVSWTLEDRIRADGSARLRSGERIIGAVAALDGLPVAALLCNCSPPEVMGVALRELGRCASLPIGAYANAFRPIPDHWDYAGDDSLPPVRSDVDPDRYAVFAADWLASGARIIGGCCEVGPDHIRKIRFILDDKC
ncbi:MAG: homocysteine S-methyltransferase family protein [Xanthomonadales bacterium]|nr:homocysteine S-methyltransferase family protein [Xanthomonadales bacterium]